jgi:hypothetical protein
MNKILIGAAALAVLLAYSKKGKQDMDDTNPAITPLQKRDRTITFYKA